MLVEVRFQLLSSVRLPESVNGMKKVNSPKGAVGNCSPDCMVNILAIVIMQIYMMENYHANQANFLVIYAETLSYIVTSNLHCYNIILHV